MNRYFKIIGAFTVRGRRSGQFMRTLAATAALIVGMCLAAPTPSEALTTGICGPVHALTATGISSTAADEIGFCNKSVTLSADGSTLTITLENINSSEGYIVADAFNLPAGIASAVAPSDPDFVILLNGAVVVAPFADRTTIVSLGGTLENAFESGFGDPTRGIGPGASATFVFTLTGATGATEQGIFDSQLIRFFGFTELGAPGDRTSVSRGETTPVPEPSTFWLLGTALTGGGFWSRRRMIVKSVLRVFS
jgi:hypothetical protein